MYLPLRQEPDCMKLFTNEQIRAIDRYTIETEGVAPAELIERVAEGIVDA